jgi:hypothetical protein
VAAEVVAAEAEEAAAVNGAVAAGGAGDVGRIAGTGVLVLNSQA